MTTETPAGTALLTADDLLRLYSEGVRGELIRGVLCETMPTGLRHGKIVSRLVIRLGVFIEPKRLGTIVTSDSGVLVERDPDTVREPDIAFTSVERMPLGDDLDTYAEAIPDLVVEVVSPNDKPPEVREKARMWLSHGVRLVWVVYPETRGVDAYQADAPTVTLDDTQSLDGLDVLPGFSCAVADIFDA